MINNNVIRNTTKSFPAIQGLLNDSVLGKIHIKNLYQAWQGESIKQIRDKEEDNPYSLRIGNPNTDRDLQNDSLFFILHYLSFNPLTKNIEKRELIPYRNVDKIYIGQSLEEKLYKDYRLFVDGNIVARDIFLENCTDKKELSLSRIINNLTDKIEKLQLEIVNLKRQLGNVDIYKQGITKHE